MYRVTLVNMPFGDLEFPSIALTQLKYRLEERCKDGVQARILYLNHDFAKYLGVRLYTGISGGLEANMCGLGDWFFRRAAFPELPDNTTEYLQRFFPHPEGEAEALKPLLLRKRAGLDSYLHRLITTHQLEHEDLVGFTSMFCQNAASFATARKLKERNPKLVTVIGGANCEAPMGQAIVDNVPCIDFVFSGPALVSFPDFVEHQLNGDLPRSAAVKGVLSRNAPRFPMVSECGGSIGEELDVNYEIPLDYNGFLQSIESHFPDKEVDPILMFETSRGCWWGERAHCTFCGLNGSSMNYRSMEPAKAEALIESLFRYYPRSVRLDAVDNIMPKAYLTELFPKLKPPEGIKIFYEVKADLTSSDMEVLSKAGVKLIQPGIESLATSTLKLMKKGTTSFQNLAFLKNCVTYGITPAWNLLIGFPGESEDVYRKYVSDIPLLTHLPPPSGSFPVRFDRYSPYFVRAQEYNLDLQPSDFYGFIYPFDSQTLARMAYYFRDMTFDAPYLKMVAAWSGRIAAQVGLWRAQWADGSAAKPRLSLEKHGNRIFVRDSRNGCSNEYSLDEDELRMLACLARPRRLGDLQAAFPDPATERAVRGALQARGLLFEENGRFLSLVVQGTSAFVDSLSQTAELRREGVAAAV
jgi:ribosomal peptide maturation radical SAM protein 1